MATNTDTGGRGRGPLAAALVIVLAVVAAAGGYGWYLFTRDPVDLALEAKLAGRTEEAAQMLRDTVAANPQNARAHFELGRIYLDRKQNDEAANAFQNAYTNNARHREAYLMTAVALALQGNEANRSREITALETMVEHFPSDFAGWYLLGLARGTQGNTQGQIEALRQAVSIEPTQSDAKRLLGVGYALQGDYRQAEATLAEALQQGGSAPAVQATLGFVANQQGQFPVAIDRLRQGTLGDIDIKAQASTQLGILLLAEGDAAGAQQALNEAYNRDSTNGVVRFFRALAMRARGLQPEALVEFEGLAATEDPMAAEAAVQAAQIYLATGDRDKAREQIERAGVLNATGPVYFTTRGRVAAARDDLATAQESFRRALQADPNFAPAHLEQGLLLVRRELLSQGIKELERYVELVGPNQPEAHADEIALLIEQLRQAAGESATQASVRTAKGNH